MRGKTGQFFLLAAVIISAVIFSFGTGTNRVTVNDEPRDFYASSDEVQREIASFLDYMVFSNATNDDLVMFLDSLAENIEEMNPEIDVAFIYNGNRAGNRLTVRNYGPKDIYMNLGEDEESVLIEARNQREMHITESSITRTYFVDLEVENQQISLGNKNSFLVKIDEDSEGASFSASDIQRVILVMQKEERGDVYVSIG